MAKPVILWKNQIEFATALSCITTDPEYPIDNLKDWREFLIWKTNSSGQHTIEITLNSIHFSPSTKIRALVLYGFCTPGALAFPELSVQYSSDQTNWYQWFFSDELPTGNTPGLFVYFDEQGIGTPNYYWRLTFTAGTPMNMPLQTGILFLGDFLEFPCYPETGFDPNSEEVILEPTRSESGYLLGVVEKYHQRRLSVEFPFLPDSWVRGNFLPFWNNHIPKPFFFAWDRENRPEETYLVEIAEPRLELPYNPIYRSLRLEMTGRKL